MIHPTEGGSYRREENGSLTRVDAPAETLPKPELPAEPLEATEPPADQEAPTRKGKA